MFESLMNVIGVKRLNRVALIGSRKAPNTILDLASTIGSLLSENGVVGHSGGASGMDTAFMKKYDPKLSRIYIPNWKFYDRVHDGISVIALDSLSNFSRAVREVRRVSDWDSLEVNVRRLFMRNVAQVLGESFDNPVDAVIYGAHEINGFVKGGTRIAVNIARNYEIPCFNLYDQENREAVKDILGFNDPVLDI